MSALFKKYSLISTACITLLGNTHAQQLSFDDFDLIAGKDLQAGASYRFNNVTKGVDAILTVESLSNASLIRIDDSPITSNRNDNAAWRPVIGGVSSDRTNQLHYVDFNIVFYANENNTPATLDDVTMSIFDTDGDSDRADFTDREDGNVIEFAQVAGFSSLISAGDHLTVKDYADGSKAVSAKNSKTNDGVTDAAPWLSVWNFEDTNAFSVRLGWSGTDYIDNSDNDRLYGAYFNGEHTPEIVPEPSSSLMILVATLPLLLRRKR